MRESQYCYRDLSSMKLPAICFSLTASPALSIVYTHFRSPHSMKKLSLLLGTLGGAMAGYLFSNQQLRKDLSAAKTAESAAKILGKHLQQDGKKIAVQVQDFVESDEVQKNLMKAKKYAETTFQSARKELGKLVSDAEGVAGKTARRAEKTAMAVAKRAVKGARKTARKIEAKVRKIV